jgi:hypothetical protein
MSPHPSLEIVCSSLLYLLSRYARSPERRLEAAIRDHLRLLSEQADEHRCEVLRQTSERLFAHWSGHGMQAAASGVTRRVSH